MYMDESEIYDIVLMMLVLMIELMMFAHLVSDT